jgi:hypothetical protein
LPPELKKDAELYAGCVSGAIEKKAYIDIIQAAGFEEISIKKETEHPLPAEIINKYDALKTATEEHRMGQMLSITINARKPH